ncbi:MAG: rod shape-determining protein MreC [Candidatus Rokubacteria bacterium 13_1_40CM_2_68_13]|nr:MAG: rod shape-determining protein MreC [Candidatus Rokubacteria bacterium 13_1_40CM_2_68_13]
MARVTTPVQKTLSAIHRGAFGLWSTYLDWKNVRAENRRLRDENQRLRVDALAVSETAEENQRLRRMLDLKARLPLNTLTGEIIAREWGGWVRSLTVNRGRADDVRRLTAVISPDGLVGRVVDVRPGAAVVQVLTDPTSTVGAHAVRTRTPGVVEGEPRGTIRFKYMARDGSALQAGDLVVTSGLGGLFPRGIPVGRVRAIDDRGSALFSFATLEPAVNFAKIDEVLLLTGDRMEDVTAYFPTGG